MHSPYSIIGTVILAYYIGISISDTLAPSTGISNEPQQMSKIVQELNYNLATFFNYVLRASISG